jgi:hypothetical protein
MKLCRYCQKPVGSDHPRREVCKKTECQRRRKNDKVINFRKKKASVT